MQRLGTEQTPRASDSRNVAWVGREDQFAAELYSV